MIQSLQTQAPNPSVERIRNGISRMVFWTSPASVGIFSDTGPLLITFPTCDYRGLAVSCGVQLQPLVSASSFALVRDLL